MKRSNRSGAPLVRALTLVSSLVMASPALGFFFGDDEKSLAPMCTDIMSQPVKPDHVRGFGEGESFRAAKLSALQDIAERINVSISGTTQTRTSLESGEAERAFLEEVSAQSSVNLSNATELCAKQRREDGLWFVVFEADTRNPIQQFGVRLASVIGHVSDFALTGNQFFLESEIADQLRSVLQGQARRPGRASIDLRLERQHGGWYLAAMGEQVRLRPGQVLDIFHINSSPRLLMSLARHGQADEDLAQLVAGEEFTLTLHASEPGYISVFNVYGDGRVANMTLNRQVSAGEPLTLPDEGQVFNAALLEKGKAAEDVYIAMHTRAPVRETQIQQLRENAGLVSGENSYSLHTLLRTFEQTGPDLASLRVTTLPN
jgi:hypothetical protein